MKSENISIRTAKKNDMLTVYEQICDLENKTLKMNDFRKTFNINVSNKNIIYLVAAVNKKEIVGFISCHIQNLLHHEKRVAEIQELYVNKKYRQQGVGTLLINKVVEKLKTKKIESFEVTAQNKRKKTHDFYISTGFNQSHLKFTRNID
jgi:PhnO protein